MLDNFGENIGQKVKLRQEKRLNLDRKRASVPGLKRKRLVLIEKFISGEDFGQWPVSPLSFKIL